MAAGTMTKLVASDGDIDTSDQLNMFEAYGKVFIVNGTNRKVADFINIKLTTTDIGSNIPHHSNILTGGISGARMIVDLITTSTGACTLYGQSITDATFASGETVTGTNDDDGAVSFVLNADEASGPHWYDWITYANDTDTYGEIPSKLYLGVLFHGRNFVSGNPDSQQNWYASRLGNPWDFSYASNDVGSPVAGHNAQSPGKVGDAIRSLVYVNKDYLVFGCANSLQYLQGDPARGGEIMSLTNATGIFGANSYCFDNNGIMYFWGTVGGLWRTTIPGTPECISAVPLPKLLKDEAADPSTHRITMGFDLDRFGILVCITKLSDGTNSNYWYDLRTEGFFPEDYPDECGVYSVFSYAANDTDYTDMLLGCKDGYIRKFDDDKKSDDIGPTDQAIDSYAIMGPVNLSDSNDRESVANAFNIVSAGGNSGGSQGDSNDIAYSIYVGRTPSNVMENVSSGNAKLNGTFTAPGYRKGQIKRRKVRGKSLAIKVGNSTVDETWSMESLEFNTRPVGRVI